MFNLDQTISRQIGAEHGMARDLDSDDNEVPFVNEVSSNYNTRLSNLDIDFHYLTVSFSIHNTDKRPRLKKKLIQTPPTFMFQSLSKLLTVNIHLRVITRRYWATITLTTANTSNFSQSVLVLLKEL